MQTYQKAFIDFALSRDALRFGQFQLKSGRISPYFFNAGAFNTGKALARLGSAYASAIVASGVDFDMLFGPAYKGIPLVSAVAVALAQEHDRDVPWAFNRKEAKDHGEGGWLVGAPLTGRVLVVDDVITAGTAIGEVAALFAQTQAEMAAVMVALDRQEKGRGDTTAIQDVEHTLGVKVHSIVGMTDIIAYLEEQGADQDVLQRMHQYRGQYGA